MTKAENILGIPVSTISMEELHRDLQERVSRRKKSLILNVNVHAFNLAYQQTWLRDLFNRADLVFCDGAGVRLAGKLLGYAIPERITYADWTWKLAQFGAAHNFSFYFLGARPGIAEKAASRLKERYPDLCIMGIQDGYFDKTPGSPENEAVIRRINTAHPDILIVGFGMPIQEKWLMENWDCIDSTIALAGGAVFDYISGELRRAPRWMTDHGLEWLGRLVIEPRRLWRRYLIGNPLFFWRVLMQRFGLLKLK